MARPFHLAGAAIVALLLCSVAGAQRGGMVAPRMMARPAPAARGSFAPARSFSPSTALRGFPLFPNSRVIFSNGIGTQIAGVPGLGFDYPHLAAVSGNFRFNPPGTGSPRGGGRRGNNGAFVPIIWGGEPYYGYPYYDTLDDEGDVPPAAQQGPAPQPQVIVIQQPVPMAPPAVSSDTQSAPAALAAAPAPAPARDTTGFVLIRTNGQVLFASAYSVIGSSIRYITPEGIVRTVTLADLDMDSTRSMNEARGVAIFPN